MLCQPVPYVNRFHKQRRKKQLGESVYEIITEKIIEKLKQGVIPWRKPFVNGGAVAGKIHHHTI
jgi:antirestriction protein ArdC